jgi:glycosyltransferase involved in cell wall biosynthesis
VGDVSVSILILTYNEEVNIGHCLDSVAWSDDIVVLDSHSTDRTGEVALAAGARLVRREFDHYAGQRTFGLTQIAFRYPWVLMLDADERVPEALREEMVKVVAAVDSGVTLLQLRRRDHLFGKWIRGSSGYPTWFGRLARVGHVRVERPINEEYHTDGRIERLHHALEHYPFNKGFSEWIRKHDRYSTMEAELIVAGWRQPIEWTGLVSRDPARRRKQLKALLYRVPGRPLIMFLSLYLLRGGVLEGRAGLTFSLLRAWYEFMIDCKTRELRRRVAGQSL